MAVESISTVISKAYIEMTAEELTEVSKFWHIIRLVKDLNANDVRDINKLLSEELEDVHSLALIAIVAPETSIAVRYPRVLLAVLAPRRTVEINQDTDTDVSRHIDSSDDSRPRVLIDRRNTLVRSSLTEVGSERPIAYRESNGIDANVCKISEVAIGDECVPVSLKHSTSTVRRAPS